MTGRALVDVLALAGGEWPSDQFMAWLSSAPLTDGPGGRPLPASRWDALSAEAGVVKGPDQWRQRLAHLAIGKPTRRRGAAPWPASSTTSSPAPRRRDPRGRPMPGGRRGSSTTTSYRTAEAGWPADELAAAEQVRAALGALAELDQISSGTDLASFRRAVRSQLEGARSMPTISPGGGSATACSWLLSPSPEGCVSTRSSSWDWPTRSFPEPCPRTSCSPTWHGVSTRLAPCRFEPSGSRTCSAT